MSCNYSCDEHCPPEEDEDPEEEVTVVLPRKVVIEIELAHNWAHYVTARDIACAIDAIIDEPDFIGDTVVDGIVDGVPEGAWDELYDSKFRVTTRVMQDDMPMTPEEVQAIS